MTYRDALTCFAGVAVALTLVAGGAAHANATVAERARFSCALGKADSAWISTALTGWQRVSSAIQTPPTRFPILVFFDSLCAHRLDPAAGGSGRQTRYEGVGQTFVVGSAEHGGTVRLPDGDSVPARLVSFTSRLRNGEMFFVMSLPSVWRSSGRSELLATAVFMHEFTHTQSPALAARVDALIRRGLPERADDDIIQKRFDSLPDFGRAYVTERDLLFQAVSAPTGPSVADAARRALAHIDRRRSRFLRGTNAVYADAEDVFLSMEGTGQFAAYLWLLDPQGGAMPPSEAMTFIRRGGHRWSQDEGLALLLVLSRLDPAAPRELFGAAPTTILPLLRQTLARRHRASAPK